ncbi:MAG: hypothetical protein ACKD6M_04195 [Candidatus Bathyarchaeota archaeon]
MEILLNLKKTFKILAKNYNLPPSFFLDRPIEFLTWDLKLLSETFEEEKEALSLHLSDQIRLKRRELGLIV